MGAVENIITDNLPIWSSAIQSKSSAGRGKSSKRSLYGVKKLRELILDLAVRGLLVPQDPSDEPASVLLETAKADKERLFQEGVIKKKSIFTFIDLGKSKLKVPNSWAHLRLGDIGFWAIGSGFPKNLQGSENKEYLFSKVSDMNIIGNEKYLIKANNTVSKTEVFDNKLKLHPPGTVVFPKIGGAIATNKRRILTSSAVFDNNCLGIIPLSVTLSEYLFILLSSIDLTFYQAGTSVPALSQSTLELIEVGLPSIAEQHRIVAKADELMALCDTLEQQQEDSIQAHETLVEVLLEALSNADAFQAAWGRISEHFDVLFTTDHSINKLKETILQLAVMGKLVPQDPSDEPAEVTFKKLDFFRSKHLQGMSHDNPEARTMLGKLEKLRISPKHNELPGNWTSKHLIQLCLFLVDCHNKTAPVVPTGIPIIRTTNIRNRAYRNKDQKFITEATYQYWSRRCPPQSGDIIFTREAPVGEALIIPENTTWCLGQRTMLIKPALDFISNKYLLIALTEQSLLAIALEKHAVGSTVKHLRVGDVEKLNIPIPPLAEQHRIVAKVDELLALCDQLKSSLQQAQETQIQLTDAVVENAL